MEKLIFLVFVVLIGSAICSMIEAALFSVPLNKAKILKEQNRRGAKGLIAIKEGMHGPITVVVIFTNLFNIVGSMTIGLVATDVLGSASFGLFSAVFTFSIILFSEILPKSIGESYAVPISLFISGSLLVITKIFYPFVWVIDFFVRPFSRKRRKMITEEEIKVLSHLSHMEGSIEADEKEMIQKVFKLNDLKAKDIMTPRTVVEALEAGSVLKNLEEKIYSLPHSRLPVYKENLDNVIGVCHQRDLLIALSKGNKDKKVEEFMKSGLLLFVSENMTADELIPLFQKQKTHLAIVNDEFGGTAGIITLEDVLEEIVGDIMDETDKDADLRERARKLKQNQV